MSIIGTTVNSVVKKQTACNVSITDYDSSIRMAYRAAVSEATGVRSVDEVQTPELLRRWVLPVDETFRALLH